MTPLFFSPEQEERWQRECADALRLDLQDMAARGELWRWHRVVATARDGVLLRPLTPMVPIYREIIAVDALLEHVRRWRREQ